MNSPKAPRPIRQLQNDRESGWNFKNKGGSDCAASTLVPSLQQDAYRYNEKRTAALRQLLSDIRFSIAFCDSTLKLYLYASYAINHQ